MKYIVLILTALSFNSYACAEEKCSTDLKKASLEDVLDIKTDVPEFLKDATITVTLKDGRTSTVSANEFKVVKRIQQFIVKREKLEYVTKCSSNDRNRVSVMAGQGTQSGLSRNNDNAPDQVTVENKVGAVYGAQYQYKTDLTIFSKPLSIGVQGQTNKTGSLLLGVDF